MSTKKPKSVAILGADFEIRYVKSVDKGDSFGECDGPLRIIKIKDSQPDHIVDSTILHEIIHGILYMSGNSEHLSEELEESIVLALENGLGQIYKRKF